jgi:hypothetical protein
MNTVKKSNPLKAPAWFLAFEKRNDARFDKIEVEIKEIKQDIKRLKEDTNKRFEKIEDILKRNNLK